MRKTDDGISPCELGHEGYQCVQDTLAFLAACLLWQQSEKNKLVQDMPKDT